MLERLEARVVPASRLVALGMSRGQIRAQVDAGRWQRVGRAIVLSNGELTTSERRSAALIHAGPRALLTAFTAAESWGLSGWTRDTVHVLVPGGTKVAGIPALPIRVHYAADWGSVECRGAREAPAPAIVRAAICLPNVRPACGILAAGVQQRIVTARQLATVLDSRSSARHHAVLTAAVRDIAQGAQALSEIDFARLCRKAGLPEPTRQRVRIEPGGRRRYLDVEWDLPGGAKVVVEVDGALHLVPAKWWDDQLRQNEVVIAGDAVLRFPSAIVRTAPAVVLSQLRRMLEAR